MKIVFSLIALCLSFQVYSQEEHQVASKHEASIPKLVEHLCAGLDSDEEKARALHGWVTHNIEYDNKKLKSHKIFDDRPPEDILKIKRASGNPEALAIQCLVLSQKAYHPIWKNSLNLLLQAVRW
jgi:hypothetical protein